MKARLIKPTKGLEVGKVYEVSIHYHSFWADNIPYVYVKGKQGGYAMHRWELIE